MTEQVCKQCELVQPISNFRTSNTKHGRYKTCKTCCRDKSKLKPEQLAFTYWKAKLKKSYSLTPEDYYLMLEAQGGACAICGTTCPGAKKLYFCVDHCHYTGTVRGLLCSSCNIGIGNLKDSRRLLQNALKYLDGKPTGDDAGSPCASIQRSKENVERLDI